MGTLALVACGGNVSVPAVSPPDEIAGFRPTTTSVIEIDEVAAEAVDTRVLSDLLDAAGFESGTRYAFAGDTLAIRRLDVRVLHFESSVGATSYLEWLRGHASDLIGNAEPSGDLQVQGIPVFVHVPDACCPREPAVALAAWRHGRSVVRVVVAGPAADGPRAAGVIQDIYRAAPASDGA